VEKSEGHVRAYHAAYLHCCAAVLCAHPAIREGSEFDPIGAGRRKALGSKGGAEWGAKVLKCALITICQESGRAIGHWTRPQERRTEPK
jgi:hypothetical protein